MIFLVLLMSDLQNFGFLGIISFIGFTGAHFIKISVKIKEHFLIKSSKLFFFLVIMPFRGPIEAYLMTVFKKQKFFIIKKLKLLVTF